MDMTERKQICAVRIDSVKIGEPDDKGMIPVRVNGVCAIHSAAETGERNFAFQYLIGSRQGGALVVAQWADQTPQQAGNEASQ